jgi:signal transduction histidine kinase
MKPKITSELKNGPGSPQAREVVADEKAMIFRQDNATKGEPRVPESGVFSSNTSDNELSYNNEQLIIKESKGHEEEEQEQEQEELTMEKLKSTNEEIRVHNKMQNDFINIAAHDIRGPIQPILGLTEALRSKIHNTEQLQILDAVIINAKRLQQLTADLLDVSKIESLTIAKERKIQSK